MLYFSRGLYQIKKRIRLVKIEVKTTLSLLKSINLDTFYRLEEQTHRKEGVSVGSNL
jgi:hypothetical protein